MVARSYGALRILVMVILMRFARSRVSRNCDDDSWVRAREWERERELRSEAPLSLLIREAVLDGVKGGFTSFRRNVVNFIVLLIVTSSVCQNLTQIPEVVT